MAAAIICSDFGAQENSLSLFPLFFHLFAMNWWDWMPWFLFFECWVLSQLFHSALSPLSAIMVVSYTFLRLLIFSPTLLISAYASSSLAFHMMYFAYKLNKQGDNIQPWRTPFPILNQSIVPRLVLTVASWPRITKIWNTATPDTGILNNGNYHSLLVQS